MKEIIVTMPAMTDVKISEIVDWCTAAFGPGGHNKKCTWRYGWMRPRNEFFFKIERDALAFRLRWM